METEGVRSQLLEVLRRDIQADVQGCAGLLAVSGMSLVRRRYRKIC